MRVGLFTREFPPHIYGGAGVHVDYLSRELAKKIEVEVHCWGDQQSTDGNLTVCGAQPWSEISEGTTEKFKGALEAFSLNLTQVKALSGIDLQEYQKTSDTSALIKYGVDPTRPYVLFVGRITRQKGVTHLVDAIGHLPPDTQVVLCAGAPDTPEIAAEMREKVEQARVKNPH